MRRAGTQRYQRRAGWDQLCDAVPRGVLQSKRQSGWKQFDIERATDRLLLSRLVSPRWPQDHPLRAAQLQSCARLTSNIVVADDGLASCVHEFSPGLLRRQRSRPALVTGTIDRSDWWLG